MKSVKNIISIDIPSGIYGSKGVPSNIFINATHTISFSFPKVGHFLSTGYSASGELFLYSIGHNSLDVDSQINLIDKQDISNLFRPSDPTIHKYLKGKVLSLSGSSSYTGAALLSSKAAIHSGAGIVKQIIPSSLHPIMLMNKEVIDVLLNDNQNGFLAIDNYKEIEKHFDWPNCFIIGPGLSSSRESVELVSNILKNFSGNCILDASGFLSLSDYRNNAFSNLPKKTILTPHYGELSKILNISNEELNNNTIEILTDISGNLGDRILVLKGPNTIIVNGYNQIYIISNGNQLLSTAGSGDILTGRLSGIIAHHVPNYLTKNRLPTYETNCIEDWESKVNSIVDETLSENMTLISGIPPWVQMYFEKLKEKTGNKIKDIFPNFDLFIYGGVNYQPYKQVFEKLIGRKVDGIELYPASEGFIAYQDSQEREGMLLCVNHGIFYEFIPSSEFFEENQKRISLEDVKIGVNYVLILNTNAGLWGYNIGDTIKFVSINPYRIVVTGRIKHFTSAFGEHVIAEEVEKSLEKTTEKYHHWQETDVLNLRHSFHLNHLRTVKAKKPILRSSQHFQNHSDLSKSTNTL